MAPPRRPQTLRATWPLGLGALVVAALGTLGVLEPLDQALDQRVPRPLQASVRDAAPLLIGIDEDALGRLGSLPWTPDTWTVVGEHLAASGIERAYVVEPLSRLVREGPAGGGATSFQVPDVVWAGPPVASMAPPPPFQSWPHRLELPAEGAVIRGVQASGPAGDSALCHWARCPSADPRTTPLHVEPGGLPMVRLSALLDGQATRLAPGTLVLVGVTAPAWARHVAVGDRATLQTWPEAVALATATLRARAPVRQPGPWGRFLLLGLITLVTGVVAWREGLVRTDVWVALAPVSVGLAAAMLVSTGLVALPLATLTLAALLGPVLAVLSSRAMMLRFLRRSSLDLARADLGRSWDPALDPSPEGLLRCLASLTWNHCPTDRMALLTVEGDRVRLVGGFGVGQSDLRPEVLQASALDALSRRHHTHSLLTDPDLSAHLVPVRRGRTVLGYWLVAWSAHDAAPEVEVLVDLARWVESRLDAPDEGASFLRLEDELSALRGAIARSAEARTWQGRILGGMHLGLATADRTGAIIYENEAWRQVFIEASLSPPRSVREVAFQLGGDVGLSRRMRRLFVGGERLVLPAPRPHDDGVIVITPVGGGTDGFVAWVVTRDDQPSNSIVPPDRFEPDRDGPVTRVSPTGAARPSESSTG